MKSKYLVLLAVAILLAACGKKTVKEVEKVEYIYMQPTSESDLDPAVKYAGKKKLLEIDSYCYYLLKFDKDAIDGVVAKIAYVNTNPDNKNLELKIVESNVNGFLHFHGSKGNRIALRDNWDGTYNIEFRYNDHIDKINYIQLKLEASVNGRKFPLETLEDGSLTANNIKTVKAGSSTCVIIGDTAYSDEYIYITSEKITNGWAKGITRGEIILVDTEYIEEGLTKILWYPENKETVLESLNKKYEKDSNNEYVAEARKLLEDFLEKVAPYISPTDSKME